MRIYKENRELIKKIREYEEQNPTNNVPDNIPDAFPIPIIDPSSHEKEMKHIIELWIKAGNRERFQNRKGDKIK